VKTNENDVAFNPAAGDFVVADADGVAVAPKERYDEDLSLAKRTQSEDQARLPLIEKYRPYPKTWQELQAAKQVWRSSVRNSTFAIAENYFGGVSLGSSRVASLNSSCAASESFKRSNVIPKL